MTNGSESECATHYNKLAPHKYDDLPHRALAKSHGDMNDIIVIVANVRIAYTYVLATQFIIVKYVVVLIGYYYSNKLFVNICNFSK